MKKEIIKQSIERTVIALNVGLAVLNIAKYITKYLEKYGD